MWAFLNAGDWHGRVHQTRLGGYRISVHRQKIALGSMFLFAAILCRHNAFIAVMPLVTLGVLRGLSDDRSPRRLVAGSVIGGLVFAGMLFGATLVNNALTSYRVLPWHVAGSL